MAPRSVKNKLNKWSWCDNDNYMKVDMKMNINTEVHMEMDINAEVDIFMEMDITTEIDMNIKMEVDADLVDLNI